MLPPSLPPWPMAWWCICESAATDNLEFVSSSMWKMNKLQVILCINRYCAAAEATACCGVSTGGAKGKSWTTEQLPVAARSSSLGRHGLVYFNCCFLLLYEVYTHARCLTEWLFRLYLRVNIPICFWETTLEFASWRINSAMQWHSRLLFNSFQCCLQDTPSV
jgi:hypothetical protein